MPEHSTEHSTDHTGEHTRLAKDQSAVPSEVRAQALALGLNRLTDVHLQQFAKAARSAAARRAIMQASPLVPADEPAHVYRLG